MFDSGRFNIHRACILTLFRFQYVCGAKGKITLEKQWSRIQQPFALQTIRKDILVHDPTFTQYRTLEQLFPVGSTCFMLGHPNYGCQAEVLQVAAQHRGRVQLNLIEPKVHPIIFADFRKWCQHVELSCCY